MRTTTKMIALVLLCLVGMGVAKPIVREYVTDFEPGKVTFEKGMFEEGWQSTKDFFANLSKMELETGVNLEVEDAMTFSERYEVWEDNLPKTYLTDGELPESMALLVGGGELYIEETDEEEIFIEAEGGFRLQGYVESGKLTVSLVSKSTLTTNRKSPKVYLYIPQNLNFFDIQIDVGAGELYIDGVSTATMTAKVGAGKTSMSDMVVSDADLSVAAGNMDFAGKIRGNAKCVLTAGKMNMQLDGEVTDYNYRVSETAGGVLLDGDSVYTEDDKAAQIDHGATKSIELYCTMGEIKVDFTSSI